MCAPFYMCAGSDVDWGVWRESSVETLRGECRDRPNNSHFDNKVAL
jgi:hypothetical protein